MAMYTKAREVQTLTQEELDQLQDTEAPVVLEAKEYLR